MIWDRPSSVLLFELLGSYAGFLSSPALHVHSRQMTSGILQVSSSSPVWQPIVMTYCCSGLAPRRWSTSHLVPPLQTVCQSKPPCDQESVHNQQRPSWLHVSRETGDLSFSLIISQPRLRISIERPVDYDGRRRRVHPVDRHLER